MGEHDRDAWEARWERALETHGDGLAQRPANAHVTGALADLAPGRALDAGCGHGAETLWLAARGWRVTGVDFAANALAKARSIADGLGADVAERVEWVEGDLSTWTPVPGAYDLVVCIHVHVAGAVEEFVQRMAVGVAPGGTLFLVGATAAAGQVQVGVADARGALDPEQWELLVAEERPRATAGSGDDAVIRAVRRGT